MRGQQKGVASQQSTELQPLGGGFWFVSLLLEIMVPLEKDPPRTSSFFPFKVLQEDSRPRSDVAEQNGR